MLKYNQIDINKKGPDENPAPFKIQYPMKNRRKNKWKNLINHL